MRIAVYIYSKCKRWQSAKIVETVEHFVRGYEVLNYSDEEARKLGITAFDDDDEYLTLHLENGDTIYYPQHPRRFLQKRLNRNFFWKKFLKND